MTNDKLSSLLEKCRITAVNASDPAISEALLPYGYTPDRLQTGVTLYNETALAFQIQKKEYTEQYFATNAFITAFDNARQTFKNLCKIATIAFKNNTDGLRLIPASLKISKYSEFKTRAMAFYSSILTTERLLTEIGKFGVNNEAIQNEMNNLTELEALNQKRFIEEGEAQNATDSRNKKFEQLKEYCSELRTIAKIALANQPQQLEKLGILVRNGAPKKAAPVNTVPEPAK